MGDDFIFIYWDEPFLEKKEDGTEEDDRNADGGGQENGYKNRS
jgi:hypothetical protein